MFYSPIAHASAGSGFFFPDDKNLPSDAFPVAWVDFKACIGAPEGSVYQFAAPASGEAVGTLTLTEPAPPTPAQQLKTVSTQKIAQLYASCDAEIVGGFTSSALGAAHTYPSSTNDQRNLSAAVTRTLMPNLPANWSIKFRCADSAGNWALVSHSASQIQQVLDDGVTIREGLSVKLDSLVTQIGAVAALAPWKSGTIAKGAEVVDANGNIWSCTTAGKTASTEPTWPGNPDTSTTVTDGAAAWTFVETQVARVSAINW